MKTSKVLQQAKKHLITDGVSYSGNGMARYICRALEEAEAAQRILEKDMIRVQDIIGDLLGACAFLEDWLEHHHGVKVVILATFSVEEVVAYRAKMQATRHAWVDSLIAEYQSVGD